MYGLSSDGLANSRMPVGSGHDIHVDAASNEDAAHASLQNA
jgi:hypothetical protein